MGKDQDSPRARRLDEPQRGDGLARPGRVLEPEPASGVRVLGRVNKLDVFVQLGVVLPVEWLLVLVAVLLELRVLLTRDGGRGQLRGLERRPRSVAT